MSNNDLIFTPLKKAIAALFKALSQPKNEFTRDAVIQRFEYTFELCWKFIKRTLKDQAGIEEFNSIKNLFRDAARLNIIQDTTSWFKYLEARNLTTHTYNEETAEETYRVAKEFAPDAEKLLTELEKFYANSTK